MKRIKRIIKLLKFIDAYGWSGFLTYLCPVYWKQDIDFVNDGRDIWSFKELDGFYFKGTIQERNKTFP